MSSAKKSKPPEPDVEPSAGCCGAPMGDWYAAGEKCAREEPLKCAGIAFVAGILLTILPVGQIVGGLLRLVFGLIRPALLILGLMKVFEEIEKRKDS
jgi:hypothetical protein